jgi:hypothetical protein
VQKTGGDADLVQAHLSEDVGHFDRMNKVRLSRRPFLSFVMERGKEVRAANEVDIRARAVFLYRGDYVFDPYHRSLNMILSVAGP